jgi:hypothetical protein
MQTRAKSDSSYKEQQYKDASSRAKDLENEVKNKFGNNNNNNNNNNRNCSSSNNNNNNDNNNSNNRM